MSEAGLGDLRCPEEPRGKSLNDSPLVRLPSDPPPPTPSFTSPSESPFRSNGVSLHFTFFCYFFLLSFLFFPLFPFSRFAIFPFFSPFWSYVVGIHCRLTFLFSVLHVFFFIFLVSFASFIFFLSSCPPRLFPLVSIRCWFTFPSDFLPVFCMLSDLSSRLCFFYLFSLSFH